MKRKMVWRYWCDFCGKGGCAGGHMARHEKGCTANPARVCGVCRVGGLAQTPIAELVALANGGGDPKSIADELMDAADGCPACTLAAIRQSGRCGDERRGWREGNDCRVEVVRKGIPFDFKAQMTKFWAVQNDDRAENYY